MERRRCCWALPCPALPNPGPQAVSLHCHCGRAPHHRCFRVSLPLTFFCLSVLLPSLPCPFPSLVILPLSLSPFSPPFPLTTLCPSFSQTHAPQPAPILFLACSSLSHCLPLMRVLLIPTRAPFSHTHVHACTPVPFPPRPPSATEQGGWVQLASSFATNVRSRAKSAALSITRSITRAPRRILSKTLSTSQDPSNSSSDPTADPSAPSSAFSPGSGSPNSRSSSISTFSPSSSFSSSSHADDDPPHISRPAPPEAVEAGQAMAVVAGFKDSVRHAQRLAVAPRGTLMALADNLGRVLLLDTQIFGVVRMWKVCGGVGRGGGIGGTGEGVVGREEEWGVLL
ncbi:unnamed protein product [Closterium sp. NIES-54]